MASKAVRFAEAENIIPLKVPVDSAGTAWASPWVDLKNQVHATFFIYYGNIAATSADQSVIVTMEAATAASSGSEVQIPFTYRASGATGANTWGTPTAATASGGMTVATTDDNKMYLIDIATAGLDGLLADARFVRLVNGIDAGGSATVNAAWAVLEPRYAQNVHISAT